MRALTSTCGMRRAPISRMVAGHISDSVKTARSGCQWSRKRRTARSRSSGTYWWKVARGNRSRTISAEVTVPVVMIERMPCSLMRSISGITAMDSPTLAAWNQTSGPAGRSALA